MTRSLANLSVVLLLAACGQGTSNAPTDPADPAPGSEGAAPAAQRPAGVGSMMPGTGPVSFVGRWATDVSWCANTQGAERPIQITTTRFEGYENTCAITAIDQRTDSYVASLSCESEGMTDREQVRMNVDGQTLRLTYMDRDDAVVTLTKCTTLGDTAQTGPQLPTP